MEKEEYIAVRVKKRTRVKIEALKELLGYKIVNIVDYAIAMYQAKVMLNYIEWLLKTGQTETLKVILSELKQSEGSKDE